MQTNIIFTNLTTLKEHLKKKKKKKPAKLQKDETQLSPGESG